MTDSPTTILTSVSTQTSSYVSSFPSKRKRRPAGTPDPDAEVIALSPKTLMESDRYICEICNQGFQRDQNLQMHRRRHKVPWKLLKRADPEVRKRVYVCPEPSCLHHNPCHALGDLVGIKKHYRRKHSSMKQWECDKCSKAYAVQSDYKAHLKTCGTRGHCCDCGRVFSRVESFIEHQDTCTAASNKRGAASISEEQASSLLSLAAAPVDHHRHHATLMPTNSSSSADQKVVIRQDNHHHTVLMNLPLKSLANNQECGVSASPILPFMQSPCPAHVLGPVVPSTHTSLALPTASHDPGPALPSFLLATILPPQIAPSAATPHLDAAACSAKVSWEIQQPGLTRTGDRNLLHMEHKAELQLLPTKAHSSQGKDINPTHSTTIAAECSAQGEEVMNQCGLSSNTAPCKLQLSIGFFRNDDHDSGCLEDKRSSQLVLRNHRDHEGTNAELHGDDCKATNMQWLARSKFPATRDENHHDTLSNKQSDARTPVRKQGIVGHDRHAVSLELATGTTAPGARSCSRDILDGMNSLEMQKKQDCDYFSIKRSARNSGYGELESARTDKRCRRSEDDEEDLQLGSLKGCNISSGVSAAVAAAACDQQRRPTVKEGQPNLLSRQIVESGQGHQCWDFLFHDSLQPQLAAERVAELRLQRAREKLKQAMEEKLEAERAWKEVKREKEQAEAEQQLAVAGVKKSASDYRRADDEEGMETRKSNDLKYSHDSSGNSIEPSNSSASMNSLITCEVSTSANPLPMQLNAGGVIISGPTFLTCPSCHHHTQILCHPANLRGTLFLPSQELLPTPLLQVPIPQPTTSHI
ncbi:hypothetical protein L7F22_026632 [Adiantum nelumboides]|nr:hypothetical protein [Adiantum nelumboides]